MSLTAVAFLLIFVICAVLALLKGPFWGILLYIHVYFNMPSHQFWRAEVPDLRWSMIVLGILLVSAVLHKDKLSTCKLFSSWVSRELLLLYGLILLTGYFSLYPQLAAKKIHFFLGYILIYFLVLKIVRSFDQLVLAVGWIILETFQLARLAHGRYHGGRLDGVGLPDASSANLFGALIAMVLPFFLPFVFSANRKVKIAAFLLAPFIVNAFVMCGSRGAFVGAFGAALLVIFVVFKQRNRSVNKKAIFICLLIAIAGFWALLSPDYKDRLLTLTDENVEQVSSGRVDIWEHGMKMVLDHPFGVGPAGFLELSPQYIPQKFLEKSEGKRAAHNTYLLVLAEQGWLGLLLYLVLIATVYRQFHRCWLKLKKDECLFAEREIIFQVKVEYVYLAFLASFTVFVSSVFFASRLYFEFFYILLSLLVVFFHLVDENRAGLQQGAL